MARSELRPLKQLLAPALTRLSRLEPATLEPLWREAAGSDLARNTRIRSYTERVLLVEANPDLMSQLWENRSLLLERLRQQGGKASFVRIDFVAARWP